MAYTRVNPYIELVELLEELKITSANVGATPKISEDELYRAIDRASRWVDDYTGKDYFFHDHSVTPLVLTQFDQRILGNTIFLPYANVLTITEVSVDDTVLVVTDDYIVGQGSKMGQIFRASGEWVASAGASIKGTFGYAQASSDLVPTGLPQTIKTATRWVAAAMSGRNKLDGLDANGQPASMVLTEIPEKVFKLLGRAAPLLC